MEELTKEVAWKNIVSAVESFSGTKQQHLVLERCIQKIAAIVFPIVPKKPIEEDYEKEGPCKS